MPRKPNFMIVITDQQSGDPYWPEHWEEKNLPAMHWLKNNGLRTAADVKQLAERYRGSGSLWAG